MGRQITFLSRFLPRQQATAPREIVRAAVGAGIGIGVTAAISTAWLGAATGAPLLIAPIGASAVLLFAVPASPLAQPYAMLGGNVLAALVGVTAAWLIPAPIVAALVAVAMAVAAMAICRCIHPPSGAVALVAVLGGSHVLAAGYGFVVVPVLLNSVLLVAVAMAWHQLTGQSYPHAAHPVPPSAPAPVVGPTQSDYEAVIAAYGETLTIDAADLRMLYEALASTRTRELPAGRPAP